MPCNHNQDLLSDAPVNGKMSGVVICNLNLDAAVLLHLRP